MRANLTLETGFAAPGMVDLDPTRTLRLGRNRTNDIVLHDQHASRWHAELYCEGGSWVLRDLGTTNGTKINGTRITSAVYLNHGEVVGVGDVRLRFALLDPADGLDAPTPIAPAVGTAFTVNNDTTIFQPDDLNALFHFMNRAVHESTPRGLVTLALTTIHEQIAGTLCGFISLDQRDPLPRILVPGDSPIDPHLSQELSRTAQATRKTIWLGSPLAEDLSSKSLSGMLDALCVPLLAGPDAARENGDDSLELLGLLHVYAGSRPFNERSVRFCEVLTSCLANNLRVLRSRRSLEADNQRYRGVRMSSRSEEMVGNSEPMQRMRSEIRRFLDREFPVLIHGETGSGKELVALALHKMSRRRKGPFIEVNCAAIPRDLAESQFFGHRRGSFSGAISDHAGHFQRADEGVLFLDEVGDMPIDLQGKLLRVLESGTFTPIGAETPVTVDVRVVVATHRNLRREVSEGRFREDFFYRLGGEGLTLEVPPLRDHMEDIGDLAQHFLEKFNQEYRRRVTISEAALERLLSFSWPGNVRQLRAVLERALAMCDGTLIEPQDLNLPRDPLLSGQAEEPAVPTRLPTLDLEALEEIAIKFAVERAEGNNTRASQILGIHRSTLLTKLEKYRQREEKQGN